MAHAHTDHAAKVEHVASAADQHVGSWFGDLVRKSDILVDTGVLALGVWHLIEKWAGHSKAKRAERQQEIENYHSLFDSLLDDQRENFRDMISEIGGLRAEGLRHGLSKLAKTNPKSALKLMADMANAPTIDDFKKIALDGLIHPREEDYAEWQAADKLGRAGAYVVYFGKILFELVKTYKPAAAAPPPSGKVARVVHELKKVKPYKIIR